jgi:hypothetical protein
VTPLSFRKRRCDKLPAVTVRKYCCSERTSQRTRRLVMTRTILWMCHGTWKQRFPNCWPLQFMQLVSFMFRSSFLQKKIPVLKSYINITGRSQWPRCLRSLEHEVVGSNPTRDVDACELIACIGWSPVRAVLSTVHKLNSMVWVRERTIPTERPPLVGEVIANFCG